jgi:hypothetical protein
MPPSDPYFQLPITGTNVIGSFALRERVLSEVGAAIASDLATVIDDFRLVGAGFRVKQAGPESRLPLHQDPTQVDESRYWLINVISPIVDTSPENGALQVVTGSHNIMPSLRSLDLEDRAETLDLQEAFEPLVETVPLKAGDTIFYFQALLHGSGPNLSESERPVVLGTLLSREAPVTVYFRTPGRPRLLERYEVPDNYFHQFTDFDREHKLRPKVGKRIGDVEDPFDLSRDEIIAAFRDLAEKRALPQHTG